MYRCLACSTPLPWFATSLSSPSTPLHCPGCGVEQHRRMPVLPFFGFYLGVMAALVAGLVAMEASGSRALGALALVPAIAVFAAWEAWLYRRGEMVATPRWFKWLARGVVFALFALIVSAMAAIAWQSGPSTP